MQGLSWTIYRTHCNTLQHTATHCNSTHLVGYDINARVVTNNLPNTLQHTATHCTTLQHTATAHTSSEITSMRGLSRTIWAIASISLRLKTWRTRKWVTHTCHMTHSYLWHDSFICVTHLIHVWHMCDVKFMCVSWRVSPCNDIHVDIQVNKSCRTYTRNRVICTQMSLAHICMRHVTHGNGSCRACEWVMSCMWMCRVTHVNESWHASISMQINAHYNTMQHTATQCNTLHASKHLTYMAIWIYKRVRIQIWTYVHINTYIGIQSNTKITR